LLFQIGTCQESQIPSFVPSVASTSIVNFQLIVDLLLNPYLEGVEYIQTISCNKLREMIIKYFCSSNSEQAQISKLIVEYSYVPASKGSSASDESIMFQLTTLHVRWHWIKLTKLIVGYLFVPVSFYDDLQLVDF